MNILESFPLPAIIQLCVQVEMVLLSVWASFLYKNPLPC